MLDEATTLVRYDIKTKHKVVSYILMLLLANSFIIIHYGKTKYFVRRANRGRVGGRARLGV